MPKQVCHSRERSLLSDLADGLSQQMGFWGCDARDSEGSLLVAKGFQRIARADADGEGSSRYRRLVDGGVLELHSFCAGWYPVSGNGVIFVRQLGRVFGCSPGLAPTPGDYTGRLLPCSPDDVLRLVRPFVESIIAYEQSVLESPGPLYRERCWQAVRRMPGAKAWLRPAEAIGWMTSFASDPASTPRARDWGKSFSLAA